ncbi:hypothetical protein Bbelb_000200 [Branchiostoma belcheri]|nr:hypothetical protein Bbelb_000200 [Branchiostoma belcheri]
MAAATSLLRGAFRSSRAAVRLSCRHPYSTEAAATSASGVNLVEANVDWLTEVQAQPPVRVRGREWLPGSHSLNFPEFLSPPRPGYPRVFTPDAQVNASPEECAVPARKLLEDLLDQANEGAVLFRGLPLHTPEDFSRFMSNLGLKLTSYRGGSGVRHNLAASVDTASNEPPDFCIEPHNEMAYTDHFPEKRSLDYGTVPESWKEANIAPILLERETFSPWQKLSRQQIVPRGRILLASLREKITPTPNKTAKEASSNIRKRKQV